MGNSPDFPRDPGVVRATQSLERDYAEVLALLDPAAATRRMTATVPAATGLQIAWSGVPDDDGGGWILCNTFNAATGQLDGTVVHEGTGLGGRTIATGRASRVNDYCTNQFITSHYKALVRAEGLKAMVAVPVTHDGRLLGLLYGANREGDPISDRNTQAMEEVAARTAAARVVAERARHAAEVAVHEERRRLAIELHDTVGALLYTVGAGVRTLGQCEGLDQEVRERLRTIEQHAAEATAALRGSLRVLHKPPEEVALGVSLREHCEAFQKRTGVPARVITLTDLPPLDGARVGALAAAVREALLNIEKHAGARSAIVSVFQVDGGVAVSVADDGVGFPSGKRPVPGLGITSVTERLARVGGTVTLSPNEDCGATLQMWIGA